MNVLKISIILLIVGFNAKAQVSNGLDTSIEGRITRILKKKEPHGGYHTDQTDYIDLKLKADRVLSKFDFLNAIIADSYYGGGKSNQPLKNDLLEPSSKATEYMKTVFVDEQTIPNSQFDNDLDETDSILNSFYQSLVKNRYKNFVIKGDDDDNMLVEVEVKVFESYSGKKELSGFEVSCESPFVKNYSEDFGVTNSAKRRISPGYRRFWVRKGTASQSRLVRIVFGDPNTYQVTFSNAKSEQK